MTDHDTSLAKAAAREALAEFLEVLGLDVTTAAARQEVQRDFIHLRTLRLTGLAFANKVFAAIAGAIGTGAAGGAWYILTHWHA